MKKLLMCASLMALSCASAKAIHLKNDGPHAVQYKIVIQNDKGNKIREGINDETPPNGTKIFPVAGFIEAIKGPGTITVTIYDSDPHRETEHASCTIDFTTAEANAIDRKTVTYNPRNQEECEVL